MGRMDLMGGMRGRRPRRVRDRIHRTRRTGRNGGEIGWGVGGKELILGGWSVEVGEIFWGKGLTGRVEGVEFCKR